MPLYEYRCRGCGHVFELIHPMNKSADDETCPKCGRNGPEKLMSAVSSFSSKKANTSSSSSSCGGSRGFT